jgi:hypothetical protein
MVYWQRTGIPAQSDRNAQCDAHVSRRGFVLLGPKGLSRAGAVNQIGTSTAISHPRRAVRRQRETDGHEERQAPEHPVGCA